MEVTMSETDSQDGVTSQSADASNAAEPQRRKLSGVPLLIVAIGVVLFVQALFVFSYIGALHQPKPHKVAFGVVGTSPLPIAVGKQFSLNTTRYASEADALSAIDQRKIDGALIAGPAGAKLIVVPAAGNPGASALSAAFIAGAAALDQKLVIVQSHPLPSGDASGAVSFFVVMALIVGGYLSSTLAMAFGGGASRRRRLGSLAIAAVVGALLTDTLAGPVLGAIPTSKFLVLWALFTLIMMAVAFATAALQTVLGAGGTLIVVIVFVIFGAPSSGGTVPASYLPALWRTIGPYLPAGAGTTIVRNTIYFDGNRIAPSLIILAAYLVVGALAVLLLHGRRAPTGTDAEAKASSAAATAVVS
jgi:hypothetical protein